MKVLNFIILFENFSQPRQLLLFRKQIGKIFATNLLQDNTIELNQTAIIKLTRKDIE